MKSLKKMVKGKMRLNDFYKGKDILVTGGCGSIGSEIVRQLIKFKPKKIRVLDQNESGLHYLEQELKGHNHLRFLVGDIRDKDRLRRSIKGADIVFHAAALKHVTLCETNPYEAVLTNAIGTQNLVDVAREENVGHVIAISTDKAVNPVNTMGATKLLSERLVLAGRVAKTNTKFSCVRFGNVLNTSGSVIPTFIKQIEEGGPVTVTSDKMTRFFMSLRQAVGLVLKTPPIMQGEEIFILKMDSLAIKDLAEVMIAALSVKQGNIPENIKIKIIGPRPGEKMYESLINEEEIGCMTETEDMYVLKPAFYAKNINSQECLNVQSSKEQKLLSKEEIKEILVREKIL